MNLAFAPPPLTLSLLACMILVATGAAVQVAVGAGLSVVCGPFLLLWLGPAVGVPMLLSLNLLVSVVATACDGRHIRWPDAVLASVATLAGCGLASLVPGLSETVLKILTAAVLVVVALPRPPAPGTSPSPASATGGVALAGLVTGALTVWTATPGPITPVALVRAGHSGADVRRTMQPISVVCYGAALAWVGVPGPSTVSQEPFGLLAAATLAGIAGGYALRGWIDPARVILLVRIVAAVAALLLIVSVVL